ncbi:MAG TPA: acetoin utilization protein AcuC [Longimicrobiales bacterium]|nr:acetoin utilization protein AcuC [Longimicrobiales bacterium]
MHPAAIIWDDALASYRFNAEHPLNPRRLELTLGLIRALDLLDGRDRRVEPPRDVTAAELEAVHDVAFIDTVKRASTGSAAGASLQAFGLGSADVPVVPGMHEAAARVCGATLRAAEIVMDGGVKRAFSIAGGLHHARRAEAAGFCIYNDLAVAIRWLQQQHNARVMCVDIDAHHGDGTQAIFYDDPDVLTVSIHESGAFLYPGTGFIDELGEGDGYGYSVNVPLDPHTDDASFLNAVRVLVPKLAEAFQPDVIVLQAGCDAHVLDPLTHLRCTTNLYADATQVVCDVADRWCDGRIIATGGGGYAVHQVVPRAWTLVWATLCGIDPGDAVPDAWLADAERDAGMSLPRTLRDAPDAFERTSLSMEADATNRQTVDAVRRQCLSLVTGWGLGF